MWEYIAGLFDGDGGINFFKTESGEYVKITITNTYKEVLFEIRDFLGFGHVCLDHPARKATHKDGWRLTTARRADVKVFLENVLPYLRIKKKKALKAIDFLNNRDWKRPDYKRYGI